MAEGARARGLEYVAITDDSASHGFGDHVTPETLRRAIEAIARGWTTSSKASRVLAGTETNILPDGSLDYPDELLGELDWVIGLGAHLVRGWTRRR